MKAYRLLAIFTYQYEYAVLEGLFREAEINYLIINDTLASILPFHSNAFGGIQILVHRKDFEEAKRILDSFTDTTPNLKIV